MRPRKPFAWELLMVSLQTGLAGHVEVRFSPPAESGTPCGWQFRRSPASTCGWPRRKTRSRLRIAGNALAKRNMPLVSCSVTVVLHCSGPFLRDRCQAQPTPRFPNRWDAPDLCQAQTQLHPTCTSCVQLTFAVRGSWHRPRLLPMCVL